jgi:phage gp36-like protein
MSYCTLDDIAKLLSPSELAQLSTEAGDNPDGEVIADAIDAADGEIDAYIGVRYKLPLPEVPLKIKAVSVDLAIYWLFKRRSIMTEVRRQAWLDGMAFLKDISAGKAHLQGANTPEDPGAQENVTQVSSQRRVFDRHKLREF